jgi:hypothetical protein
MFTLYLSASGPEVMAVACEEFSRTLTQFGFTPGEVVTLHDAAGREHRLLPLTVDLRHLDLLCRHLRSLSPICGG